MIELAIRRISEITSDKHMQNPPAVKYIITVDMKTGHWKTVSELYRPGTSILAVMIATINPPIHKTHARALINFTGKLSEEGEAGET